jgi:predicted phosphoribosyltransferase
MVVFENRVEAGRKLASELLDYTSKETIVVAIPRGGVVVGYEIAHKLQCFLDVIVPRKIGAPFNPELAIGAVTEDGTIILDVALVERLGVPKRFIQKESERERSEIKRRLNLYRGELSSPSLKDCNILIVDDGIATGSTIKAALASIRKRKPKKVLITVPVAPYSTVVELEKIADQVICLAIPEPFYAIGQFYRDFTQTSDQEVIRLLRLNREELAIS